MPGFFRSLGNAFSRIKQVESTNEALNTQLKRCLSTVDLTLIGIGSTLGSGVYVLTGDIAKTIAGPGIVLSFFIAAIASILAGICYAEFGARVPRAGSAYVYTYVTAGELCGFIVGWTLLLEYGIGAATVGKGLSSYLDATVNHKMSNYLIEKTGKFSFLGEETHLDFFAFSFNVLVTVFISFGMKNTSRLNNVCTFANILVIIMVITMGAFYCDTSNWKEFAPFGGGGIVSGASSCFFAFIGFDVIATSGEEASKPSRSIPIAVVGTITICFLAYFGVATVITLMVNYQNLVEDSALSRAFDQNGNHAAKYIISAGALIGLTGTAIVALLPMPRLLYSMAKDGLVFKFLSSVNPKTEVPVIATFVSGFLTSFMCLLINLHALVEMVSIGTLLAYTFVVVSVLLLRYHPDDVGLTKGTLSRSESPVSPINLDNDDIHGDLQGPFERNLPDTFGGERDAVYECETPPYVESIEKMKFLSRPTDKSYTKVVYCVIAGILVITGISVLVTLWPKEIEKGNPLVISVLCILVIALVVVVVVVWKQPQNQQKLYFKVPFLPWLPFLSIFFNIYLMVSLNKLTWLRFAVWMVVGFAIYFGYGIFHSVERVRFQQIDKSEEDDD